MPHISNATPFFQHFTGISIWKHHDGTFTADNNQTIDYVAFVGCNRTVYTATLPAHSKNVLFTKIQHHDVPYGCMQNPLSDDDFAIAVPKFAIQ